MKKQPFGRIYDLVQFTSRHRGISTDFHSKVDILQVHNRLLTTILLIRCDYAVLLNFLGPINNESGSGDSGIRIDLRVNRKDCDRLIEESQVRSQRGIEVEGHLY